MDAAQAIADLTEISPQVRNVVAAAADGSILGSNLPAEGAATLFLERARRLLDGAEAMRPGVAQIEAATTIGSVFVVRDTDRLIAATTTPEPTVGLVFYDLKTCLRSIDDAPKPKPKPKRRAPAKKKESGDAAS